jgi:amidase
MLRPLRLAPLLLAALLRVGAAAQPAAPAACGAEEATVAELQAAMAAGRCTSRAIVEAYLARIEALDRRGPALRSVLEVNPDALALADALDRERAAGRVRGPLHGIPIALKDNIHATHMPTSGGALAFDRFIPPYEATLTRNLTAAGAIIIAKTTLSELAGYVAGAPTPAPGNYNAVSGQGFNPYDPRRDPRPDTADGRSALTPAGSSSGSGTAANLWAANIGTGPSNVSMPAAVKPTVGRVSRWGVIPITADQDTAGPMARTVTDAAILLGALEGTAPDPNDAATSRCTPPPNNDYTAFLRPDALRGARIFIPRAFYYDKVSPPGGKESRGGLNEVQAKAMAEAIDVLKQQGAVIIDLANIPSVLEPDPAKTILDWNFCGGAGDVRGKDTHCTIRAGRSGRSGGSGGSGARLGLVGVYTNGSTD